MEPEKRWLLLKVEKAAFVAFGVFVAVSAAYVALLLC
jgi:hypothetical protein